MPILSGQLWKIATGFAGVITIIMMGFLIHSSIENRALNAAKDQLVSRIDDPKTGYVVQLAQARTNVETLKLAVERQNKAYATLSAESKARLADTERRLALAQAETRRMEKRLASFLATKPQGSTLEDRVRDIDRRALEELIK